MIVAETISRITQVKLKEEKTTFAPVDVMTNLEGLKPIKPVLFAVKNGKRLERVLKSSEERFVVNLVKSLLSQRHGLKKA